MRRFTKYTIVAILLCITTFGITRCNQAPKKPKFQVVSIDKVGGSLDEGWKLTLTVANNTSRDIVIKEGWARILHNGGGVGQIKLNGEVALPRHRCSQIVVPLKASFSLKALPLLVKLRKGDYSAFTVDYTLVLQGAFKNRVIEQNTVPLDALAKELNFGLKK